jgi:hypothetical protein
MKNLTICLELVAPVEIVDCYTFLHSNLLTCDYKSFYKGNELAWTREMPQYQIEGRAQSRESAASLAYLESKCRY